MPDSPSRTSRLESLLTGLLTGTPEIEAAAVVTHDGLPMASALPAHMDEEQVAAMSAALLSLGEKAAEGLGRGDLSQVSIEAEAGGVHLVGARDLAVVVAVSHSRAKSGMVLFELKHVAEQVAMVLSAREPVAGPTSAITWAPSTAESLPVRQPIAQTTMQGWG